MRQFTIEDFSGAGQYLIRMSPREIHCRKTDNDDKFYGYTDTGYLSTIMYKVCYLINNYDIGNGENIYGLCAMSDGMLKISNYTIKEPKENNYEKNIWQKDGDHDPDGGKRKLVEWLNNEELSPEYRFATQEEVVRVAMYQKSRWRNG